MKHKKPIEDSVQNRGKLDVSTICWPGFKNALCILAMFEETRSDSILPNGLAFQADRVQEGQHKQGHAPLKSRRML